MLLTLSFQESAVPLSSLILCLLKHLHAFQTRSGELTLPGVTWHYSVRSDPGHPPTVCIIYDRRSRGITPINADQLRDSAFRYLIRRHFPVWARPFIRKQVLIRSDRASMDAAFEWKAYPLRPHLLSPFRLRTKLPAEQILRLCGSASPMI